MPRLTLSTNERDLVMASFLHSARVATFAPHCITPSILQHDKITGRFVTTQLYTFRHAIHACRLQQHACIPAIAKFHVIEEHSLSAETFCDR